MKPCVFKPLTNRDYEIDLGVTNEAGAPCVATVAEEDGCFVSCRVAHPEMHMTEPGLAFVCIVKYDVWRHPAVLYFRSRDDRQRYITNRIAALKIMVRAKHYKGPAWTSRGAVA